MIGTNPSAACGDNAWPPDIDGDAFVDIIGDIARMAGLFGLSCSP